MTELHRTPQVRDGHAGLDREPPHPARWGPRSGWVAGGCAGVGAAGGEGPGEVSGLSGAFDVPAGCLFVAVVVAAAGVAVAPAAPSLRRGDGVFVVGLVLRCPAGAQGAVLVEDGGQVPEEFAGIVAG